MVTAPAVRCGKTIYTSFLNTMIKKNSVIRCHVTGVPYSSLELGVRIFYFSIIFRFASFVRSLTPFVPAGASDGMGFCSVPMGDELTMQLVQAGSGAHEFAATEAVLWS